MVEDHNEAVKELESYLVKYLKGGEMASKRPTLTKGGFMGMGGQKKVSLPFTQSLIVRTQSTIYPSKSSSSETK